MRPPVDPMSDLSWARVERGLWPRLDGVAPAAEPKRTRRPLWVALPAVAVAAAVAVVFAWSFDAPKPLPTPIVQPQPQPDELPLRVVSSEGPSSITHGDAHVTLDPESAVVNSKSTAVLERGGAWFTVAKPYVVVAGDAIVRVADARFRVARFAEHVTVEVERGAVELTYQGTNKRLAAGESWSSQAPPPAPRPPKRAAAEDARAKYERLLALEASDPAAAITGYLELARGHSRWAEISLFAAARLSADRREARARVLLDMYLRRFPNGANAADARQLLERLEPQ